MKNRFSFKQAALTSVMLMTGVIATQANASWSWQPGFPKGSSVSYLVQEFSAERWAASNYASPEDIAAFEDMRFGLMVSFGITAYDKTELSWGTISQDKRILPDGNALADGENTPDAEWVTWADKLTLEDFDAKEWVRFAQDSGFKYIVILAKHHEGYHMWDTEFSDFKITNSPFGRDFVKEIVDACHEAGMPIGIYYSQRDWYHPDYQPIGFGEDGLQPGPKHEAYKAYQFDVVRELMTQYGKIDIFWWDALWWGGMFNEDMWDSEALNREIRRLQPHIVINNRASIPGDFDTPEQRLGGFQGWRPWEAVVSLEETWSHSTQEHKSTSEVIELLINTVINNGNLLLSLGPRWGGDFVPAEVDTMQAVGDWLRKNGEAIYATRGGPWKPRVWGGSVYKDNVAYLHATTISDEQIRLEVPPGVKIRKISLLHPPKRGWFSPKPVSYKIKDDMIWIKIPEKYQDPLDTIVKIETDRDLATIGVVETRFESDALVNEQLSPFAYELVYGPQLTSGVDVQLSSIGAGHDADTLLQILTGDNGHGHASKIETQAESSPRLSYQLAHPQFVTGVLLKSDMKTGRFALSLSKGDGWETVWTQDLDASSPGTWDIEVNDFKAGAQTPGKLTDELRLEYIPADGAAPMSIDFMKIWAKGHK